MKKVFFLHYFLFFSQMEKHVCKGQHFKRLLLFLIIFLLSSVYLISTSTSFAVYINNDLSLLLKQTIVKANNANTYEKSSTTNPSVTAKLNFTTEGVTHYNIVNNTFVKQQLKQYLIPFTKGLHCETLFNDSFSEHILRNGTGLELYTNEKNEEIWIENGVQYRPFPFLEKANNYFYTSEFEAYVPFNKSAFFEEDEKKSSIDIRESKIILWWQHKIAHAPINGLNPLRACPDFPCVSTSDRKYTENSSAMLVNAQFVNNENPPIRRRDQVLIHYQIEAPSNYWFYGRLFNEVHGWNSVFNWTMSYRMDSDITTYHGLVRRRRVVKEKNYKAILAKKKGLVAWIVSSCSTKSKRAEYVKELQKYIPIDIYGACGPFKCPRDGDKNCLQLIETHYKFYLGFENNLCKDYITEKLYKYLDRDLIVIARGYDTYSRLLPSEIFLNTANFKSPKQLADKLLYLNSHDQEYIKMLKEKDKYFTIYEDYPLTNAQPVYLEHRFEAVPMCNLCQRLWNLERYSKVIENMSEWFHNPEYQCQSPNDM